MTRVERPFSPKSSSAVCPQCSQYGPIGGLEDLGWRRPFSSVAGVAAVGGIVAFFTGYEWLGGLAGLAGILALFAGGPEASGQCSLCGARIFRDRKGKWNTVE